MPIDVIYMFNEFGTLGIDLTLKRNMTTKPFNCVVALGKVLISGLIKSLDKDLQHQTRRGLPLTPMQQVLIALRVYATGTFQRVIGNLFGVFVFVACTVIYKVSRAIAKQKRQFLSSRRTWLISRESFMLLGTFQV